MDVIRSIADISRDTKLYIAWCKEARQELKNERKALLQKTQNLSNQTRNPDYPRWLKIRTRIKELSDEALAAELGISKHLVEKL